MVKEVRQAPSHLVAKMDEREFVDRVADALLCAMADNPTLKVDEIARRAGYSTVRIYHFRAGIARTLRVAMHLVDAMPELGDPMRCKCCGRLPEIRYERMP